MYLKHNELTCKNSYNINLVPDRNLSDANCSVAVFRLTPEGWHHFGIKVVAT